MRHNLYSDVRLMHRPHTCPTCDEEYGSGRVDPESFYGQQRDTEQRVLPEWRRRALAGDSSGARDLTGAIRS